MKAVLMSIQPKWCEKIASGKKTVEVRTTFPKEFLRQFFTFEPFKVYIYCTKSTGKNTIHTYINSGYGRKEFGVTGRWRSGKEIVDVNPHLPACQYNAYLAEGKVIGEFICNKISAFGYSEHIGYPTPAYEGDPSFCDCGEGYWITGEELEKTQLTYEELYAYGKKKTLYGWHISDLVIYDEPKQLSDFESYNVRTVVEDGSPMPTHKIERAPQSWVYVRV